MQNMLFKCTELLTYGVVFFFNDGKKYLNHILQYLCMLLTGNTETNLFTNAWSTHLSYKAQARLIRLIYVSLMKGYRKANYQMIFYLSKLLQWNCKMNMWKIPYDIQCHTLLVSDPFASIAVPDA